MAGAGPGAGWAAEPGAAGRAALGPGWSEKADGSGAGGAAGPAADAGEGTDFDAVANGWVSVTPLQVDLTHFQQLEPLQHWLGA